MQKYVTGRRLIAGQIYLIGYPHKFVEIPWDERISLSISKVEVHASPVNPHLYQHIQGCLSEFPRRTSLQGCKDFPVIKIIQGGSPWFTSKSSSPSVYPRVFVRFSQEDILAEL